jgi:phenylacetate-coenzyme A ligase PaaK-like adenylate-forming protein
MANRRLHWNKQKMKKYQDRRFRRVVKYAYDSVPFTVALSEEQVRSYSLRRGVEDLTNYP